MKSFLYQQTIVCTFNRVIFVSNISCKMFSKNISYVYESSFELVQCNVYIVVIHNVPDYIKVNTMWFQVQTIYIWYKQHKVLHTWMVHELYAIKYNHITYTVWNELMIHEQSRVFDWEEVKSLYSYKMTRTSRAFKVERENYQLQRDI